MFLPFIIVHIFHIAHNKSSLFCQKYRIKKTTIKQHLNSGRIRIISEIA